MNETSTYPDRQMRVSGKIRFRVHTILSGRKSDGVSRTTAIALGTLILLNVAAASI